MVPEIPPSPKKRRPPRLREQRTELTVEQILTWADAYHERTGHWPTKTSGPITETLQETWCGIDLALRRGGRGLPPGPTLAQLLSERRGVRNHLALAPLAVPQILTWADAHHQRTGRWPIRNSGGIPEAPDETWRNVDVALRRGARGLPGGDSLACLLQRSRDVCNFKAQPPFSLEQILAWADAFFKEQGRWPLKGDGPIAGTREESWCGVDSALRVGCRGLAGGSSLAQLLEQERGVRNRKNLPSLTEAQILAWAEEHHRLTGHWPTATAGSIPGSCGETWQAIDQALFKGTRGCPGGDSLLRLLKRHGRLGAEQSGVGP
jgi:hypothetical protein